MQRPSLLEREQLHKCQRLAPFPRLVDEDKIAVGDGELAQHTDTQRHVFDIRAALRGYCS
jgi:hypothetical protein